MFGARRPTAEIVAIAGADFKMRTCTATDSGSRAGSETGRSGWSRRQDCSVSAGSAVRAENEPAQHRLSRLGCWLSAAITRLGGWLRPAVFPDSAPAESLFAVRWIAGPGRRSSSRTSSRQKTAERRHSPSGQSGHRMRFERFPCRSHRNERATGLATTPSRAADNVTSTCFGVWITASPANLTVLAA